MQTSGTSCTNQAQGQEEVQKYVPRKGYMSPRHIFLLTSRQCFSPKQSSLCLSVWNSDLKAVTDYDTEWKMQLDLCLLVYLKL